MSEDDPSLKIPDAPEYCHVAASILRAFNMIARSREIHQSGTPMPLGSGDLLSYLELYDAPIDVHIFIECIIAIDNVFIDEAHKRIANSSKK